MINIKCVNFLATINLDGAKVVFFLNRQHYFVEKILFFFKLMVFFLLNDHF